MFLLWRLNTLPSIDETTGIGRREWLLLNHLDDLHWLPEMRVYLRILLTWLTIDHLLLRVEWLGLD